MKWSECSFKENKQREQQLYNYYSLLILIYSVYSNATMTFLISSVIGKMGELSSLVF